MNYDNLLNEAAQQEICTYEKPLKHTIKGLYSDNVIWVNKNLQTNTEKICILAEELGHHHTTVGDILNQSKLPNRKQEQRAMWWAFQKLIPLSAIVQAHKTGIHNRHELAEFLDVTEDFLKAALKRYQEKYGLWVAVGKYTICFEPLGVLEMFE